MQLEIVGFVPYQRGANMIIQSDNLRYSSAHTYRQSASSRLTVVKFQLPASRSQDEIADQTKTGGDSLADQMYMLRQSQTTQQVKRSTFEEQAETLRKLHQEMINYLLKILFGDSGRTDFSGMENAMGEESSEGEATGSNMLETTRYTSLYTYSESEEVSFSTTGTVVTADGRNIEIGIDLTMSRSFTQTAAEFVDFTQPVCCDPLVINLDGNPAELSDQKFYFDLDSDGSEEEISMLSSGSGYLALDQNGNGIIDDGSELFGTKSGNGYADLAAYDLDGNGWIDEADAIFDKLRIWVMKPDGSSELVALGKAGVGAICLGNSNTEFSLKDDYGNTNGIIRRTGVFLYEDGNVGTTQQLDLAT